MNLYMKAQFAILFPKLLLNFAVNLINKCGKVKAGK